MFRPLITLFMLGSALAFGPAGAESIHQQLSPPHLQLIQPAQLPGQLAPLLARSAALDAPAEVPAFSASGGQASLQPLYSAQQGSWPFEPLVHAGLFKVIAGYQSSHPRMLQISSGQLNLAQLARQINDPSVLRAHKDGYLLSYPLLIAPGAGLDISDSRLYLYAHSGVAIINLGRLQISNSQVESWSGTEGRKRSWRPFIVAWAGSQTRIENSQLARLGHNASPLSRGLSLARSAQQAAGLAPPRLLIRNSQFESFASGLQLQDAQARIDGSSFSHMQLYGIDAERSLLELRDSQIEQIRLHSGIRLQGNSRARLQGNRILATGKAGIELNGFSGLLLAERNRLQGQATHALQSRHSHADSLALLRDNQLLDSVQNLVDSEGSGSLLLQGNLLQGAGNAIYLQGHGQQMILDNDFSRISQSAVKADSFGQLLIGGNRFDAKVLLQRLFEGQLLPVQSQIVSATLGHACYLLISAGGPAGTDLPSAACPQP